MDAGLTRLSDTELEALKARIVKAASVDKALREPAARQLEVIALEQERRLSPAAGDQSQ